MNIAADAGLAVAATVALVVQAFAIADTWGGSYWVFGCVAGLLVCSLALLRRHNRLTAACAGLAIATAAVVISRATEQPNEPGLAVILGLSVLVGAGIRVLPTRLAAVVAAGGAAVVASTWLGSTGQIPAGTALAGLGWFAAVAIGLGLRLLDARHQGIAERVRHEERLALARELHDVVAHHITGVVLQAQAARVVRRRQPERLDDSLADIESAGSGALAAMRRVVGLLRDTDDAAPATTGPGQLSDLVSRFSEHGPAVRLRLPDGPEAWPAEISSTVYRIVQESLTNVARHASRARSVAVSVAQDEHVVTVEVVDDAPSPTTRHHRGGYGLIGMRERVEALGGTLHVGPCPSAGWSVHATLPVPTPESR